MIPQQVSLLAIDYSDDTPDVRFIYDRLGRQKTVADAVGSRTFGYNSALQLESEAMTGLISETITRKYDTLGRNVGFTSGDDYSVTYGYDTTGRFNNAGWTAEGMSGNAAYAYMLHSDLLQGITTASGLVTTYTYEPHRNLRMPNQEPIRHINYKSVRLRLRQHGPQDQRAEFRQRIYSRQLLPL